MLWEPVFRPVQPAVGDVGDLLAEVVGDADKVHS